MLSTVRFMLTDMRRRKDTATVKDTCRRKDTDMHRGTGMLTGITSTNSSTGRTHRRTVQATARTSIITQGRTTMGTMPLALATGPHLRTQEFLLRLPVAIHLGILQGPRPTVSTMPVLLMVLALQLLAHLLLAQQLPIAMLLQGQRHLSSMLFQQDQRDMHPTRVSTLDQAQVPLLLGLTTTQLGGLSLATSGMRTRPQHMHHTSSKHSTATGLVLLTRSTQHQRLCASRDMLLDRNMLLGLLSLLHRPAKLMQWLRYPRLWAT